MAKEIKQKIVLSGEKEYSQALKDAQRNLKTLQTALKAETAELGANASAQDKARVKAASLKEQIAEQEKVVATLSAALGEVKEKYSDNEAEVARWEQKLNNARATLAGMKNDLAGTGEGFQAAEKGAADAVTAAKSFSDTLKDLGGVGDGVADAIEGIFTGVIDRITDAVGELWGLISSTAAKANNWTDISGYWNTDPQTIQQYARAVGAVDNSFEDLQAVVSKLVLGGKGDKITELLGISSIGYKDQWQYAMDAMDMLYAKMQSGQDINPILETLFGEKKSTKVLDLLGDWGSVQQAIATGLFNGNESGYGLSDEELGTMNDLWIRINEIEEKWNALKDNFAAGFGVATMDILVNVEGALDGLAAYMNADTEGEREAALEQIRENIEAFFRKVAQLIRDCIGVLDEVGKELQASDDPLTRMVGDIFVKISNALQWFIDNQEAVKGAFEAIFGVWLIAKLAAVAGQLAGILASIEEIKGFKGLQLGGEAVATAAGGAASGGGGGGFLGWLLASPLAKTLGGAGAFLGTLFGDLFRPADEHRGEASEIDVNMTGPVEIADFSGETAEEAHRRAVAEGRGTDWNGTGESVYVERKHGTDVHEQLDREQEIIKNAQIEALEDLFDAWRNAETGADTYEEYDRAWDYASGVLGDHFGEAIEHMIEEMDKNPNWMKEGDIPLSWWNGAMNPANWNGGSNGAMNQNGITSSDLQSFQKLPAGMQRAVEAGARAGVSGINVNLDGAAVGRLVAPYVSEYIASEMVTYEY